MNIRELAARHDLDPNDDAALAGLRDVYLRASVEYDAALWRDQKTKIGRDTLDHLAGQMDRALVLLADEENIRRLEDAGADLAKMRGAVQSIHAAARKAHKTKRGPAPKRAVRAALEVLGEYWTKDLGRPFTQAWEGKDAKGLPVPNSAAARFVFDLMEMIDAGTLGQLPSLTPYVARALKDNRANHP